MKKPSIEKRDWVKYPSLYNWVTDPKKVRVAMERIFNIMNSDAISDLEKLGQVHEVSSPFDKSRIETIK